MEEQDYIIKMLKSLHDFSEKNTETKNLSQENLALANAINASKVSGLQRIKEEIEKYISSNNFTEEEKKKYIRILNKEKNEILNII